MNLFSTVSYIYIVYALNIPKTYLFALYYIYDVEIPKFGLRYVQISYFYNVVSWLYTK